MLLCLLLTACGGGGGSGDAALAGGGAGPAPTPASVDRSGNAVGTVTGFGSVFVNGVEYETDGATITRDGSNALERDLRIGQVVMVTGTRDESGTRGTATRISFDDNVEGPIESIDLAGSRFVVLGQTVLVDASTVFDDRIPTASLAGLAVGGIVEVSGFVHASGDILATRIEPRAAGTEFEVRGVVSELDAGARRFSLGTLRVDYANATLADFDGAGIANGQLVEVKGTRLVGGLLAATRIEREGRSLLPGNGQMTELEGFVTRFASATDFEVSGQPVRTTATTTYRGGTAASLAFGVKVEVEGNVDAGVLVARTVHIKSRSNARISGRVQAVDAAGGQLTVLGVTIGIDATTQFEDNADSRVSSFNLGRISTGDYVEVRGRAGTGTVDLVASRIERDDADDDSEVRGAVESIADGSIVILGVTANISAGTRFEGRNGLPVTRAEFLAALRTGDIAKAKGTEAGSSALEAEEVELED